MTFANEINLFAQIVKAAFESGSLIKLLGILFVSWCVKATCTIYNLFSDNERNSELDKNNFTL